MRESDSAALLRWQQLEQLQEAYREFTPFLTDMMLELGFSTSETQEDIAYYLAHGPHYLMIQAQRGQAKTTITAIFAVWCLLHDPRFRVLIVSAGETQANEISTLIVKLILTVDILECIRPDRSNGDRTSVEAFDLHYSLKGIDKSPSVACVGITGNLQGKRADLLIADDVESQKNSKTAVMREQLEAITRDFVSICSNGRIIYLGTPQSMESIYNALPQRGFAVRIWPGRLPTREQQELYGDMLAPSIKQRCEEQPEMLTGFGLDGKQGAAVDPVIIPEEALMRKEIDQGPSWFQLQHMLLTAMTDALRFPLKPIDLCVMRLGKVDDFPLTIVRGHGKEHERKFAIHGQSYTLMAPHHVSNETGKLQSKIMYLDPAGGGVNGDETGYAILGHLNSNLYLLDVGGVPGGFQPAQLDAIAAVVVAHEPTLVKIEKNFGFGSFSHIIVPVIRAACEKAGKKCPGFEDDQVSGQKELRIIDTLEPVMGRGALIIDEGIIARETASLLRFDLGKRNTYSFLFQLAKISRDRNALHHDDRLDAVSGAVKHFAATLVRDQTKAVKALQDAELKKFFNNPMGYKQPVKSNNAAMSRMRRI